LGWFDEQKALDFAKGLEVQGWDVSVRGVRAFSTGGWFTDPIVSSMFTESDNAIGYLVNIIFHESVHATVLIENQQYYNESLASFVADTMTPQYLRQRFGEESWELTIYLERRDQGLQAVQLVSRAYTKLVTLYASDRSEFDKRLEKLRVLRRLYVQLGFEDLPTNATLIGARLYDVGQTEFEQLYVACGRDWRRFLASVGSVRKRDFASAQQEAFGPVVDALSARRCEPWVKEPPSRYRVQ
jgi:predicted aminopeptidase